MSHTPCCQIPWSLPTSSQKLVSHSKEQVNSLNLLLFIENDSSFSSSWTDLPNEKLKDKIIHPNRLMQGPNYRTLKGMSNFPFRLRDLDKYDLLFYFYISENKMNFLYYAAVKQIMCCYFLLSFETFVKVSVLQNIVTCSYVWKFTSSIRCCLRRPNIIHIILEYYIIYNILEEVR